MACNMCTDPDGEPCFPQYGLGPHTHHIGGVTLLSGAAMEGYTEDPESPGMGAYWCPACGDGKPNEAEMSSK